jgi:hypothetical protein
MNGEYVKALEIRARWLHWVKTQGRAQWKAVEQFGEGASWTEMLPAYQRGLETGDTFFMNRQFGDLVQVARETVPDDLTFDHTWLQAKSGWLWLDIPFVVPIPDEFTGEKRIEGVEMNISAVGWFPVEGNKTFFMCYQDYSQYALYNNDRGFGCWSHFTLKNGDKLIDRIRQFENLAGKQGSGAYTTQDRTSDLQHEIRWIYAAFHLMAQKMTHKSTVPTDRHTRKRGQRTNLPVTPFIRVISLRRLEEAREKAKETGEVDWQWQWGVRGHWRNQFYPSEGVYRQVFIESYIKGPENRPLKPPTHNMFVARR